MVNESFDNECPHFIMKPMSDQILSTIEVLAGKVRAKEEEANKLKKIINELCAEEGLPARYEIIADDAGGATQLRTDQFYGQTLTSAARSYLEIRKSRGATSFNEIYKGIKDGGYKFTTSNEENQKTALRDALRKNSSIFHRLPNGNFGLLSWYPGAKAVKEDGDEAGAKATKPKAKDTKKSDKSANAESSGNFLSNEEIRDVIFKMDGNFGGADIESKLKEIHPSKQPRAGAISMVLFNLKESGFLRIVVERKGKIGAQYTKA